MKNSMQLQSRRILLLLSAASYASCAGAGKALPVDLMAMEQTVLKLARSGKTGRNVTDATAAMRTLVSTFLAPHLAKLHNDDQDLMNTAADAFTACQTDHARYNGTLTNLSTTHQTCRAEEARLKGVQDEACGPIQDINHQAKMAACDVFGQKDTLPNVLPGSCMKTTGATNEAEALRLRDWFRGLKAEWRVWKDRCDEAENLSIVTNATCRAAEAAWAAKTEECDAAQDALDYAACWQHRLGDCAGFTRCWSEATSSYTSLNTTIVNAMAARKTEYAGLQRIVCYLDALDASTISGSDVNAGIQTCDSTVIDSTAYDITLAYYADHAPQLPTQPACSSLEVWPKPGTAEYVAQEYDVLPADAPNKDCASVCCTYCNHFPCPGGLYKRSNGTDSNCPPDPENIRAYSLAGCCAIDVVWRASAWVNPSCENRPCGQSALNTSRSVVCADADGNSYPESACANYTKPQATRPNCSATADCVTCVSSACNVTGTYLNHCGGFSSGYCATCSSAASGTYITGIGDTINQDSCPTTNCSTHSVCGAGTYLDGCGGTSAGSCAPCANICTIGYYVVGCSGVSAGSCVACNIAPGNIATSSGGNDGQCSSVQETQATPSSGTGVAIPLASFALDKDSASHTEAVSGSQLTWIRLTEWCANSSVTPGSLSYTLTTRTDRTYKIAVEAAWRPMSGHGLKSTSMCNTGAGSVLQLNLVGTGSDSTPTGANVTACFDWVTYTGWSTVWFEFAPSSTQVQMTLRESLFNCLSVKSVTYYEETSR